MDPLAPVIKPELLTELLKLTRDPKALFGPGGVLQQLKGALMDACSSVGNSHHDPTYRGASATGAPVRSTRSPLDPTRA
jgi:hypothetical protein